MGLRIPGIRTGNAAGVHPNSPHRMNFRLISLLLAMTPALQGADAGSRARSGEMALAAGLWEIAAGHFEAGLADPGISAPDKAMLTIRLAESWLRDGRAAEALALLQDPDAADHPEAPFWKAQALAAGGFHAEAMEILAALSENPSVPNHAEAVFTLANLRLAMDENSAALDSLQRLDGVGDPALSAKGRLRQAGILLDLDRVDEARKTLPHAGEVPAGDLPARMFMEAGLLMREERPDEAAMIFRSLLDQPRNQSFDRFHQAAVGYAMALLADGQKDAASSFILSFLQDHPESPELEALFHFLREAFPESPAAGDPWFEALDLWISPADLPASGPLATAGSHAAAAWPSVASGTNLTAHALFTRALLLRRTNAPDAAAEIRRIFNRLRVGFPTHPLAARAMYELARMESADGRPERAMEILEILRQTDADAAMRGRAEFLQASIAHQAGERDLSARLFDQAARHLEADHASAARFNSAILILAEDETGEPPVPADPELAADIQLERALLHEDDAARIAALEDFLIAHPDHARMPEARLALAEAALAIIPPDLSLARAQLDTLATDPEKSATLSAPRLTMVRLLIADHADDPEAAIAIARGIIEEFPGTIPATEAALVLGRNLFQSEAYNEARIVFEQLAATEAEPARAEAALLLAARSAALIPSSQSQQEALALFRRVIDGDGPLAPIATIEMARLMIDMNRLDEAADFLRGWFAALEESDPLRLPAGLLLGEAVYAMGSGIPDSLGEALAVYDTLLAGVETHSSLYNRLQYLRGRTLEQVPNERGAFAAYYSVLESEGAPAEWHYFELCGFRALALLEKAGRWPAAIACARKIASFNGPRAEEAANRASQLQLRHMIWED